MILLEIALIAAWALIVGKGYLNMDPRSVPTGSEFGQQVQANHLWAQFKACGWCAVWNGSEQGGFPAFVDVHGSMLHPIVILSTLAVGVVNGIKITVLISIWLAGIAQWWMARELRLGLVPRLFTAGIAVAGGHLSTKMDTANYQFILAAACGALVLAGVLHVWRNPTRRSAILLGILGASFILSGQGYLQLAMLGILPFVALVLWEREKWGQLTRGNLWISAAIAILLAAPFLVPFGHFAPYFGKETDPGSFGAAQPLQYLPLNLIISDAAYLGTQTLGKLPWPWPYGLFIGWVPVLLAIFGLSVARGSDRRAGWALALGAALAFFLASAVLSRAIAKYVPSAEGSFLVGGIRFPSVIATLAVPFILGLAAIGLDNLFRVAGKWPKLALMQQESGSPARWGLPLRWLLIIPLLGALYSVDKYSSRWYQTQRGDGVPYQVAEALRTDSLQWVSPPYGNFGFIEPAVAAGLKLSPGFMNIRWNNRDPRQDLPRPALIVSVEGRPPEAVAETVKQGITVYQTAAQYARVSAPGKETPCRAAGSGGRIDISCNTTEPGRLIVQENMWSGWYAWADGQPVRLLGSNWLEVDAAPGKHTYAFRYLPWDVPLGLALFVIGLAGCVWFWIKMPLAQSRGRMGKSGA